MEVRSIEAIPLSYALPDDRGFGGTRGITHSRAVTLLRLETADGAVGWGEASAPPQTVARAMEEVVAPYLEGRSPHDVETLTSDVYAGDYHMGRGPIVHSAVSAADIALWDLKGKEIGEPIHRLLGTADDDRFIDGSDPVENVPYASTMYITEWGQDPAEPMEEALNEGFNAAKIKIGRGIDDDVERVKTARETLGEDAHIMVDYNGNYRPKQAARAIEAIEQYDITWAEEPIPPENESGYRELSRTTNVPLAAGEAHYSRFEFKRLIDDRTVDIVQPNLTHCGGLSEARFIGKLATTENVGIRPHVWNGAVGLAASLHFAASIPAYPHSGALPEPVLFEFDRSENPLRDELLEDPIEPDDGSVDLPSEPGLGITLDEAAVERYRIEE
ncbi:mandelate racemase/muconate lactonizing enzyme family protein [Halopenitus sp. H-Gu1]|uniref:mandelate racemase/muconate lactonizing enzyme family protein n=1 Tax=Halopenitus sp. H-Gu1 TaxID=3242697 RepID=UPI00359EB313